MHSNEVYENLAAEEKPLLVAESLTSLMYLQLRASASESMCSYFY